MFRVAKAPNFGDTRNPKMNFDFRNVFKIDFIFFKVRKMVKIFHTMSQKLHTVSPLTARFPFLINV